MSRCLSVWLIFFSAIFTLAQLSLVFMCFCSLWTKQMQPRKKQTNKQQERRSKLIWFYLFQSFQFNVAELCVYNVHLSCVKKKKLSAHFSNMTATTFRLGLVVFLLCVNQTNATSNQEVTMQNRMRKKPMIKKKWSPFVKKKRSIHERQSWTAKQQKKKEAHKQRQQEKE